MIHMLRLEKINGKNVWDILNLHVSEEQKSYIKVFYCQGGFNYEKMKAPSRLAMKMFVSTLKNKKDATEKERGMAEKMSSSYDISDIKYIEPIVAHLKGA